MKRLPFLILVLGMGLSIQAATEYREFTSKDGKSIMGCIRAYDAHSKTVTIEREDKRTSKVPISVFSENDQAYILEWDAAKGFLSENHLKVSFDEKVVENRKEKELEDIRYQGGDVVEDFEKTVTTFERIAFEMQFQNRNKTALKEIRMEYQIYYEQSEIALGEKPEAVQKHFNGKLAVPTLPAQSKITVDTESVEIHEDNINPIPMAGGNQRRGGEGEVHGIRVRMYMKMPSGREVMREFCYPDNLSQEDFPWKG